MANDDQQKPARNPADKEQSKQQSRAVSGKQAARAAASRSTQGPKGGQRPAQGKAPRAQSGGGGNRPNRPKGTGVPAPPRRSPTALLTWGIVGLVIVVVVVLVVVKVTSSSSTTKSAPTAGPVPASVVSDVTQVPASVYNSIGVSSPTVQVSPPKSVSGQKDLVIDGKPGVFYMGAEYCPYCAAERWAMVTSFSRFGTVSGLKTMESSASDVYPSTQTFTFVDAKFTSTYVTISTREILSNRKASSGEYTSLQKLTKSQNAIVDKYDVGKYTGASTTNSHSFPFVDIGNQYLVSGASYDPAVLQGLTREEIASDLTTTKNSATRAIISTSNYISGAICNIDGQKPASVCTSKGVTAAKKSLGTSS